MPTVNHTISTEEKRRRRVRAKLFGTAQRPRVSVFRSNHFTYAQAIDDERGVTVVAKSDAAKGAKYSGTKIERATAVAQDLAKELQKQNIAAVVFDRGQYRYHGRVKAVAEALRAAGINV